MRENGFLSTKEAYAAMFIFLVEIYNRTKSDDLGSLLGGMCLLDDGNTADPAAWNDWNEAIRRLKRGEHNLDIKLKLE